MFAIVVVVDDGASRCFVDSRSCRVVVVVVTRNSDGDVFYCVPNIHEAMLSSRITSLHFGLNLKLDFLKLNTVPILVPRPTCSP